jgi:hypothetical protein
LTILEVLLPSPLPFEFAHFAIVGIITIAIAIAIAVISALDDRCYHGRLRIPQSSRAKEATPGKATSGHW